MTLLSSKFESSIFLFIDKNFNCQVCEILGISNWHLSIFVESRIKWIIDNYHLLFRVKVSISGKFVIISVLKETYVDFYTSLWNYFEAYFKISLKIVFQKFPTLFRNFNYQRGVVETARFYFNFVSFHRLLYPENRSITGNTIVFSIFSTRYRERELTLEKIIWITKSVVFMSNALVCL